MIPAINASSVTHAVNHAHKPHSSSPQGRSLFPAALSGSREDSTQGTSAGAASAASRPTERGHSIASDLGQLTTDALQLLGLGASGTASPSSQSAAQAYASGLTPTQAR